MSAVATAPATTEAAPFGRALRAEMIRAKGSASARFALVGLALSVLQGLGWWTVSSRAMPDWLGLLGWQSLYVTGLFAPVVALLASTTVAREAAAREGGTWTRPLSPRTAVLARMVVLGWQSLLLQAALTLPMLGFGMAGGLADPPVGRFVLLWLVLTATSFLPLALVLARRVGTIATVALALGWQIAGTVAAESPHWWALPWSWAVRAALPVLGIHQNAVRLEPGSPVWSWSPLAPVVMSVALAGVVVAIAAARARAVTESRRGVVARWRERVEGRREDPAGPVAPARRDLSAVAAAGAVTRGAPSPVRAQLVVLRATAAPALTVAALAVTALVGLVWNSSYVTGLTTWLVVPLGCCILACLVRAANADGWRVAALRTSPARFAAATLAICLAVLGVVVAAGTLAAVASGGPAVPAAFPVLAFAVGSAVLTMSLWLATRFGVGAALGVTLVVLVVSLVFGGTGLADSGLWVVGVLGWPLSADDDAGRTVIALVAAVAIAVGASFAWVRALARAAR